jgi:hypothetical protein
MSIIHPLSIEEIIKDKDEKRKEIIYSKIKSYDTTKNISAVNDNKFKEISEALDYFNVDFPILPDLIKQTTVDNLDVNDSIFDTLKEDYKEFNEWFESIQIKKRD